MAGAGYDISASASSSATSGNRVSIGPVGFGSVAFGSPKASSSTDWLLIGLAAIALGLVGWFFLKKK